MTERFRPAPGQIDLGAVRANTQAIRGRGSGRGHGRGEGRRLRTRRGSGRARRVLDAGAAWVGVALAEEGITLREAGIDAPILVLSEPAPDAAAAVVAAGLTPVVYTSAGLEHLAKAVAGSGRRDPLPVHLKVDTGMHRVGCAP